MKTFSIISFSIILFLSCNFSAENKLGEEIIQYADTLEENNSELGKPQEKQTDAIPKDIKPVFGHRFVITGDFDGDGRTDTLSEHYVSGRDNKETNKFYEGLSDYGQLVELTIEKEPISYCCSNNPLIDTMKIFSGEQLLGLSFLKNEGDLNGDGTDEVSYVVDWADCSNLNTWHLMTYKNNAWAQLYSFPIWDWQLPNLPNTYNQYGLFGLEQKHVSTLQDTGAKNVEKEFSEFKGLLRKIAENKIQIIFRNNEAEEDTMIVDL